MFTFLSIAFLILLVLAIFYGYGIVMRRPSGKEELETETCSLCRRRIAKDLLIERQVGDSRLFYFCAECIGGLHDEFEHRKEPHRDTSA